MLNAKYFIGCLVVISAATSCTKDKSYDITGDPEVKFFVKNEAPGNAPQNSISYTAVNVPDVAGSGMVNLSSNIPATIQFPVFASKPVSEDVVIGAELDNSLVGDYNTANGTSYTAMPAGILNTGTLAATILKGTAASVDSITITTDAASLGLLTEKAYMAPIRLTTVSKPGVGGITSSKAIQVAYIVINVEIRLIKYLAGAADAQGALITPRTAWGVIFTPAATPTGNGSIIDGSTSTYSRWGSVTQGQVDVNMQGSRNVTGIRLYTSNSSTYTPSSIDVYLSNDGISYSLIGSPLKANLAYASAYNYIMFYKAIPAQYIRLVLTYSTSTNTQNRRVTELDVYAN